MVERFPANKPQQEQSEGGCVFEEVLPTSDNLIAFQIQRKAVSRRNIDRQKAERISGIRVASAVRKVHCLDRHSAGKQQLKSLLSGGII
ncbi:hypothetical protein TNCV_4032541 [Trichonephila clavipes]|nr:hypothetical protein TNCV_4032541 [Trichonephila clavipes]